MNAEKIMELHKQHRESQSKYTYFLLAESASAIAFAIHKTTGSSYSWYQIPLGGAVIFWAFSFFYGCKSIEWIQKAVLANHGLLHLYDGIHPEQPATPEETESAIHATTDTLNSHIENARLASIKQFWFLVVGAVFLFFGTYLKYTEIQRAYNKALQTDKVPATRALCR